MRQHVTHTYYPSRPIYPSPHPHNNTAPLQNQVAESGLNLTLNDSLIILVSPEVPLQNVLLAVQQTNISSNISTVIALNNGSYQLSTTPAILSGQLTLVGGQTQTFQSGRRRRHLVRHRELEEGGSEEDLLKEENDDDEDEAYRRALQRKHYPHFQQQRRRLAVAGFRYSLVEAPANTRCIIFLEGVLQTDLLVFTGTPEATYAGGVEVLGSASTATFTRTDFLNNRWSTQGGALTVTDGARVTLGRWVGRYVDR
jgi:hypothetical protein